MVTINKQWIIKQLFFYGTAASQFTYNTNNQRKKKTPTVPVYGN